MRSREIPELTSGYVLASCSIFLVMDRTYMILTDNRQSCVDSVVMERYR